uniref:Uncharacterized protein n=1 Tax=Tanacetum cinerariifolium TaxID=118510 RepID=A0A699SNJ1_TANCI|nr:hypothetical protein [Tanacetum cinerariifolium]
MNTQTTLSSSSLPANCLTKCLNKDKHPSLLITAAKKKKGDVPSSQGIQKSTQKHLSHILRSEAAIEAIERKANFATVKPNRFSPKLLLEALDNAVSYKRWESALKILLCKCGIDPCGDER